MDSTDACRYFEKQIGHSVSEISFRKAWDEENDAEIERLRSGPATTRPRITAKRRHEVEAAVLSRFMTWYAEFEPSKSQAEMAQRLIAMRPAAVIITCLRIMHDAEVAE